MPDLLAGAVDGADSELRTGGSLQFLAMAPYWLPTSVFRRRGMQFDAAPLFG
jgi:hypothetical protein